MNIKEKIVNYIRNRKAKTLHVPQIIYHDKGYANKAEEIFKDEFLKKLVPNINDLESFEGIQLAGDHESAYKENKHKFLTPEQEKHILQTYFLNEVKEGRHEINESFAKDLLKKSKNFVAYLPKKYLIKEILKSPSLLSLIKDKPTRLYVEQGIKKIHDKYPKLKQDIQRTQKYF